MSFPAAKADPSVIGPDDPSAAPEPPLREQTVAAEAAASSHHGTENPASAQVDVTSATVADPAHSQAPATLSDEIVAVARSAAIEEAGRADLVGDYLGAVHEDEVAVGAAFAATDRGYRGWYWSVTLALVEPGRPTISEVVLLPGELALVAPPWVPWDRRIRAGDVGAGDLLPTVEGDIRLVPGYVDSDDPAIKEVEYEFGFGRPRVLSREGRDEAAQRWHDGPFGPADAIAQHAPATCVTCGFFTRLAGVLGMTLGACANEFSPADGRVVDAEYGCGAHSEIVIDAPLISASTATVVDELTLEVHRRPSRSVVTDDSVGAAQDIDVPPTDPPAAIGVGPVDVGWIEAAGDASGQRESDAEVDVDWFPAAEVIGKVSDTEPEPVRDPVPDAAPNLLQDTMYDQVQETATTDQPDSTP